ncbi:MAG: tRNA dihydrouridine synthase DusB, partial [Mesorhizobium sp.]
GVASGLRQARKHLGWYLDRHAVATPPDLRKAILTSFEPQRVVAGIREAFARAGDAPVLRSAA